MKIAIVFLTIYNNNNQAFDYLRHLRRRINSLPLIRTYGDETVIHVVENPWRYGLFDVDVRHFFVFVENSSQLRIRTSGQDHDESFFYFVVLINFEIKFSESVHETLDLTVLQRATNDEQITYSLESKREWASSLAAS